MRTILLDTHIFLWSQFSPDSLPKSLAPLFEANDISWIFSQISLLEIQVKYDLGKLPLPESPKSLILPVVCEAGFGIQALQDEAIFLLGKLPNHHRDPFDRLLITTALVNGWEIATVDEQIGHYPVRIVS